MVRCYGQAVFKGPHLHLLGAWGMEGLATVKADSFDRVIYNVCILRSADDADKETFLKLSIPMRMHVRILYRT